MQHNLCSQCSFVSHQMISDYSLLLSLFHWISLCLFLCVSAGMYFRRRWWHPTPVLLPGKSHGQRSLVGCSPWGRKVGHDWATSLSLFTSMHWRRKWQPTPVFLPGESQGQGSLVGCCLWAHTESDTTEALILIEEKYELYHLSYSGVHYCPQSR